MPPMSCFASNVTPVSLAETVWLGPWPDTLAKPGVEASELNRNSRFKPKTIPSTPTLVTLIVTHPGRSKSPRTLISRFPDEEFPIIFEPGAETTSGRVQRLPARKFWAAASPDVKSSSTTLITGVGAGVWIGVGNGVGSGTGGGGSGVLSSMRLSMTISLDSAPRIYMPYPSITVPGWIVPPSGNVKLLRLTE